MPPKKKGVPDRSPKTDAISPQPKGKRKSFQGDIEVGSPDKRPDLFGVPNATEIFDGDDEEIAISQPKKKRIAAKRCVIAIKRKGRPPKKSNKQPDCETKPSTQPDGDGVNGNDRDEEKCEEVFRAEEEMSCPHCNKRFKSQLGLNYHIGEFLYFADSLSLIVDPRCIGIWNVSVRLFSCAIIIIFHLFQTRKCAKQRQKK